MDYYVEGYHSQTAPRASLSNWPVSKKPKLEIADGALGMTETE